MKHALLFATTNLKMKKLVGKVGDAVICEGEPMRFFFKETGTDAIRTVVTSPVISAATHFNRVSCVKTRNSRYYFWQQ